MYQFATLDLLGLAVCTIVGLIRQVTETSRAVRIFLDLALGLAIGWITDYSAFAGWGVSFRSAWMGPAATGLAVGATAVLWSDVLSLIRSYARRSSDEAAEIESRMPKAA